MTPSCREGASSHYFFDSAKQSACKGADIAGLYLWHAASDASVQLALVPTSWQEREEGKEVRSNWSGRSEEQSLGLQQRTRPHYPQKPFRNLDIPRLFSDFADVRACLERLKFQSCWSLIGETWSQTMAFHSGTVTWVRLLPQKPKSMVATSWGKCNQTEPFHSILCWESETTQWSTVYNSSYIRFFKSHKTSHDGLWPEWPKWNPWLQTPPLHWHCLWSRGLFVVWKLSWLMKVALAAMRLLWCVGCAMPELQKLLTNSCMYMVSAGVCGML